MDVSPMHLSVALHCYQLFVPCFCCKPAFTFMQGSLDGWLMLLVFLHQGNNPVIIHFICLPGHE